MKQQDGGSMKILSIFQHIQKKGYRRAATPEERDEIESPAYRMKALRNGFLIFTGTPLSDATLRMAGQSSIWCWVIRIQSKGFVAGMWPNHQRLAIGLGGLNQHDPGQLIEFTNVAGIHRINDQIARKSNTFAGPSARLVQSLTGKRKPFSQKTIA